ncbi:MAG: DNA polymerase IV, partial [Oscillospiraceae bacterium]
MEKIILHCDLNNFFASVECALNPLLKNYPMAVCGSAEDRHGIVLAKNDLAKATGVTTAEVIWKAKQKCPNLVCVKPNMKKYIEYSKKVQEIYRQYTDLVEPFSIDECFLDVTASTLLFGNGYDIAFKIKEQVKKELDLTISVGVSYIKIFAKLASDMKKPDAITIISKSNYKEMIWDLPVNTLMGVGKSNYK